MGDNPPSSDDTKACPYCAETIKKAAVVCRYCGRDLPPATISVGPEIYGTLKVPVAHREIPGQERPKFVAGTPAQPSKVDTPTFRQEPQVIVPSVPTVAPAPQVVYVEQKSGCGAGGCLKTGAVIGGLLILVMFAAMLFSSGKRTTTGTASSAVALATPTMTAAELQNAAVPILYDKLARNTESYVGRLIHAAGTVVQVIEDGSRAELRVNMDDDFNQTLFVEYPGYSTARVLEGDKVVMVARVDGRVSYKTVLGAQATLPDVTALWLQVIPN